MIKNIKFRKVNNEFQTKLSKDIKKIKNSKKGFINADISRNNYEMTKEEYEKIFTGKCYENLQENT